jgi:hypothetical protein
MVSVDNKGEAVNVPSSTPPKWLFAFILMGSIGLLFIPESRAVGMIMGAIYMTLLLRAHHRDTGWADRFLNRLRSH